MNLDWLQSLLYGFFAGLMDILPVSAQAHKVLLLKFYGINTNASLSQLMIRIGIFLALYYNCQTTLIRMNRARALSRVPKKKRKRPLDIRSLMDWRLLMTMLIPALLGLFVYRYTTSIQTNLIYIAIFLFLNGLILYIPQYLPTSNRDSRTLSRLDGILMGLGATASIFPGISAIGSILSIGSVCGVERMYCLTMALLTNLFLTAGLCVYDILNMIQSGIGPLSFLLLLRYVITGICAFGGTLVGIRIIRRFAESNGYSVFGIYCWGLALFTFILNLMA